MTNSQTPRILVVEDEVLIATHIAAVLESQGFEVIGPYLTVAQALAHLRNPDPCNVAILDAHLRDESALPVAEALTRLKIPFFVVTGYSRVQLSGELASARIFTKPVDTEALISEIQRHLAH